MLFNLLIKFKFKNGLFSNCCSLEVLKLGCPRLSTLFLQVMFFPHDWLCLYLNCFVSLLNKLSYMGSRKLKIYISVVVVLVQMLSLNTLCDFVFGSLVKWMKQELKQLYQDAAH